MTEEKARRILDKHDKFVVKHGLKIRYFINGFVCGVMMCVVMLVIGTILKQ